MGVRGSGLVKNARKQKRQKICFRESLPPEETDEALHEGLWRMLPEEVFDLIFERLPYTAQCRFRCLSRRYKNFQLLTPPPACTIVSKAGCQDAMFYSDAERKWMSLPSNKHVPSGRNWELVDADAGLVCYQCNIDGWFWLWVCNPLNPSLSRLIRPKYERGPLQMCIPQAPETKLVVDRASGTYKIVATLHRLPCTAVYDSATSRWTDHSNTHPRLCSHDFFVWGSVLHAYSTWKDVKDGSWLAAFDMENRKWFSTPAEVPFEDNNVRTNRFFLSNNKELVLVLYSYRKLYRPYFSVWKFLHTGSSSAPASFFTLKNWRKLDTGSEKTVVDLRGHRLARARFEGEHICFASRDDKISPDAPRAYKCVRYSFAAERWSTMPCCTGWGEISGLHTWEPSLTIDPT